MSKFLKNKEFNNQFHSNSDHNHEGTHQGTHKESILRNIHKMAESELLQYKVFIEETSKEYNNKYTTTTPPT